MKEEPLVRVARGTPTPEEAAAMIAVLAGLFVTKDSDTSQQPAPAWVRHARPYGGSRSWRDSGLPR